MFRSQVHAILAGLLLSGCFAARLPLQSSPAQLSRYNASTEGLAVGSIAVVIAEEDETALPLLLRHGPATSTAARAVYSFSFVPETPNGIGAYFINVDPAREAGFITRLPAGAYRLGGISALGTWDSEPDGPRFTVTADAATYVGRFVVLVPSRLGNRRASLVAVTDAPWVVSYPPTASRGLPAETRTVLAQPPLTLTTWGVGSAVRGEKPAAGTCFAVSPDGLVLTSAHLVDGASALRLRFGSGLETAATVVRANRAQDVAVLQADAPTPSYVTLAKARPGAGQQVLTLGHPAVSEPAREPALASGAISGLTGPGGDPSFFQVSFPIQPGSAGTPVFFESGEVVGMVAATAASEPFSDATGALPLAFALKAEEGAAMFDAPARQLRVWKRSEAIERVRDALCRIEVERR